MFFALFLTTPAFAASSAEGTWVSQTPTKAETSIGAGIVLASQSTAEIEIKKDKVRNKNICTFVVTDDFCRNAGLTGGKACPSLTFDAEVKVKADVTETQLRFQETQQKVNRKDWSNKQTGMSFSLTNLPCAVGLAGGTSWSYSMSDDNKTMTISPKAGVSVVLVRKK
jgi:hypothetical protein